MIILPGIVSFDFLKEPMVRSRGKGSAVQKCMPDAFAGLGIL